MRTPKAWMCPKHGDFSKVERLGWIPLYAHAEVDREVDPATPSCRIEIGKQFLFEGHLLTVVGWQDQVTQVGSYLSKESKVLVLWHSNTGVSLDEKYVSAEVLTKEYVDFKAVSWSLCQKILNEDEVVYAINQILTWYNVMDKHLSTLGTGPSESKRLLVIHSILKAAFSVAWKAEDKSVYQLLDNPRISYLFWALRGICHEVATSEVLKTMLVREVIFQAKASPAILALIQEKKDE